MNRYKRLHTADDEENRSPQKKPKSKTHNTRSNLKIQRMFTLQLLCILTTTHRFALSTNIEQNVSHFCYFTCSC